MVMRWKMSGIREDTIMKKRISISGWIVWVAAFILMGTSACSIDEELQPTENTPVTYTLTVSATKGDNIATRALNLSADGKTLNATWAAGEKVSVHSVTGEGSQEMESHNPVGTLTAQSSGTTTTLKGEFTDFTPTAGAKLRLKFNETHDYTTQGGTLDYIATYCDYAVADIIVNTVDTKTGDVTSKDPADFQNQQAIVKFSLTRQDGTTPVAATSLIVKVGGTTYNITPAASNDIYVAIKEASNQSVSLLANTATGIFSYDKTGITFENGKYYAIGVKMTRQQSLGDLYYSDGTSSETLEVGKTPIGVIAYLGTDAFTENGVTLRDGETTLQSHGLVLCLRNIANVKWRKDYSEGGPANVSDFSTNAFVNDRGDLFRTTNVSGYSNTKFLAEKTDAESNYPAANQVWNYSELTAPATTTGWFIPSIQQWVKVLTALGGMSESDIVWQEWKDQNLTTIHNLEAAMEKTGTMGTAYDGMSDYQRYYWSSSESTSGNATAIAVYPTVSNNQQGLIISGFLKASYWNYYVRPVLAF